MRGNGGREKARAIIIDARTDTRVITVRLRRYDIALRHCGDPLAAFRVQTFVDGAPP